MIAYAPRGFAALTPILVICVILTTFAYQASIEAYLTRLAALEAEYKEASRIRAYSCAQAALFTLAQDTAYSPRPGGDVVILTPDTECQIESVSGSPGMRALIVHAEYSRSYTRLELAVDMDTGSSTVPLSVREVREI